MTEPPVSTWLVDGRLALAERPGGGGRSHRRVRRDADLEWWAAHGVTAIVSGMRSRHGLLESALAGFAITWHPLVTEEQAVRELPALAETVTDLLAAGEVVLVHVDRPGEWLAAVDAVLRIALGLASSRPAALRGAAEDGLPVTELTHRLVTGAARARRRTPATA